MYITCVCEYVKRSFSSLFPISIINQLFSLELVYSQYDFDSMTKALAEVRAGMSNCNASIEVEVPQYILAGQHGHQASKCGEELRIVADSYNCKKTVPLCSRVSLADWTDVAQY